MTNNNSAAHAHHELDKMLCLILGDHKVEY